MSGRTLAARASHFDFNKPVMPERQSPLFSDVGILAVVPDRWGSRWQSRHHILTRLASYFEVVWVNDPPGWRDLSTDWRSQSLAVWGEPIATPSGFQVYDAPLWLPKIGRPRWLADVTFRNQLQQASQLLFRRGVKEIVLYLWRPDFAPALQLVPHQLSCYHVDDEYSFSPVEHETDGVEAALLRAAGQVFIHSSAMMEKKGALNPHTEFAPNGVDYASFAVETPVPADLAQIPQPRIGYTGVLKDQLDWALLDQMSSLHPEWSFVFAGKASPHLKTAEAIQNLSRRPNVYFLGAKSTEELARYPQHFQVCIMPYAIDGYTKYIYPLKLHEYLATGRPVVGSAIRSLLQYSDLVLIARTAEEWSASLNQALSSAEDTPSKRFERQRTAQSHDWEILVRRIAEVIMTRLGPQHQQQWTTSPSSFSPGRKLQNQLLIR